jgi:hypothetical protein
MLVKHVGAASPPDKVVGVTMKEQKMLPAGAIASAGGVVSMKRKSKSMKSRNQINLLVAGHPLISSATRQLRCSHNPSIVCTFRCKLIW